MIPWKPDRPGYRLRTVAPSIQGVHVFAGLMDMARFIAVLVCAGSKPISRAAAAAVPMVPQVPWECTSALTVVAVPMREITS